MPLHTNKISRPSQLLRRIAGLGVAAAALAAFGMPGVSGAAGNTSSFGAEVNKDLQPSNSSPAHSCSANPTGKCTWVMHSAYGSNEPQSLNSGTLKRIKLVAGTPGKFKLQIAREKPDGSIKVVRNGPKINYEGQTGPPSGTYDVESFKVDLPIKAGQSLAIKARKTSTLRCSGGSTNTKLFSPPLGPNSGYEMPDDTDGCYMTIQGKVRY